MKSKGYPRGRGELFCLQERGKNHKFRVRICAKIFKHLPDSTFFMTLNAVGAKKAKEQRDYLFKAFKIPFPEWYDPNTLLVKAGAEVKELTDIKKQLKRLAPYVSDEVSELIKQVVDYKVLKKKASKNVAKMSQKCRKPASKKRNKYVSIFPATGLAREYGYYCSTRVAGTSNVKRKNHFKIEDLKEFLKDYQDIPFKISEKFTDSYKKELRDNMIFNTYTFEG